MTIRTWHSGEDAGSNGYANRQIEGKESKHPMTRERLPAPPAAQEQIAALMQLLYEPTRENLVGIYVHGSLAMGCFNPAASDIDLLAITRQPLGQAERWQILGGLLALSGAPHPAEISIVHYAQIDPWRHPAPFDLHFSEAWRAATQAALAGEQGVALPSGGDSDLAAHFTVLRERGFCLAGTPIAELRLAVPWSDYLDSLRSDFVWAATEGQVDPVYVVLNACRSWAAVADSEVLSKAEGADWVEARVPARFQPLIDLARSAYAGDRTRSAIDPAQTHAFHHWVGDRLGW